jgi:ribonuclease HII
MALLLPDLREEEALRNAGYHHVAGLDETGRGAWAGPVCAAAVVLPLDKPRLLARLDGVRDSKQLTPAKREEMMVRICEVAEGVEVGWSGPEEVDSAGVVAATRAAMARALARLDGSVDALLIDYLHLPGIDLPQRSLPKADVRCLSVAAASIVAKVTRDRHMISLDEEHPGYGFARHKGYGTPQHKTALTKLGPSPLHRMSWQPLLLLEED